MTQLEFWGCGFIAFGLPLAMFVLTIAKDPLRIIVFVASAFFWLLSLLLSACWWKVVLPLRDVLVFGLVFSVIFQELFRFLFYLLLKKAEEGLQKVWREESTGSGTLSLASNTSLMAYVSGFGFGVISAAFSLINVLADMTGPGTVGIYGQSSQFFITSAFLTLCFVLLHTFWGIIYFDGCRQGRYYQPFVVLALHMCLSCLTLLNGGHQPVYVASLVPAYVVLVIVTVWSYFLVGGSVHNLKAFFAVRHTSYDL
jgi:anterior pharynx defective protein 1